MRPVRKLIGAAVVSALVAMTVVTTSAVAAGASANVRPTAGRLLTSGLEGSIGGAIGPDGALYVPEGVVGKITRVDPRTGAQSLFADGLPPQVIPLGGVMDVAFVGKTAYALVTLVSADVGGTSVDGIYRIDSKHHNTVIADIGTWAINHPPSTAFDVPSGVQFALEPVRHGFLVSDGHHNRVLRATFGGDVSQVKQFGNIVPTGLALAGDKVLMGEAGPIPHVPSTGKVVAFPRGGGPARTRASGYSLIVDVELAKGSVFALSQGESPGNVPPASPAAPESGRLLRVKHDGSFKVLVAKLDLPTSLHFVGDAALVVTLNGEVWRINDIADD